MKDIDYSEIVQPAKTTEDDGWEPPVHKYFGKKLANGKMEKEPVYVHQEYPKLLYSQKNGKIVARVVKSAGEKTALGAGWEETPAAFGYIGAPSFEQHLQMKETEPEEIVEEVKRGPGRPKKE